jgi:very-short-patch-repair endonuclease
MSERARRMRREEGNAERKLWYKLREFNRHGFQFRQQAPIGPYIADFCDHSAKLIIEIDGAQHGEPKGLAVDKRRTRWLESQSYRVLRFWNRDVLTNIEGVEVAIMLAVGLLTENGAEEASNDGAAISAMDRSRRKALKLMRAAERVPSAQSLGQPKSHIVPSPLVGEGQGGGDCRTSAVGIPPTPNPSPHHAGGVSSTRRGRESRRRVRKAAESRHG